MTHASSSSDHLISSRIFIIIWWYLQPHCIAYVTFKLPNDMDGGPSLIRIKKNSNTLQEVRN